MNPPTTPKPIRATLKVLITAGPTQEPIDAVRFIGNRSSGRLGLALAQEACDRGHSVKLLLGPVPATETDNVGAALTGIRTHGAVERFRTTEDLQGLLLREGPWADVVVMSAAVADYRPRKQALDQKLRRSQSGLTIELESTPDLLAGLAMSRRPGQVLVGFALEPRERLEDSARDKLARKGVDMVVANPLETMDSGEIEAHVFERDGSRRSTPGRISKASFAGWLFHEIERVHGAAR
ncbi:MAG: phosphopantothenoylcysteine decarboxylase [Planctomycetes bacterium]|nr:phosphopantothenoylcysteine decarboxylase [Planctomycetota bacterium]